MHVLRIQNTVFKSHRRRMEMATLVFQPIRRHFPLSLPHCIRPFNSLPLFSPFPHYCVSDEFVVLSHDRRTLSLRPCLLYVLRIQILVFNSYRLRMVMVTLFLRPIRPPHRYANGEMGKKMVCHSLLFCCHILAIKCSFLFDRLKDLGDGLEN